MNNIHKPALAPCTVALVCVAARQVKVKQYMFRVLGGRGSQISRQSAREGINIANHTHRQHLPLGNIPGTHFW